MTSRLATQFLTPILIIALGVGGLMWLSAKDAPPPRVAVEPTPPLLETVGLKPGISRFQIRVSGNVVPRREVTLSAEVAGSIIQKGKSVESGRYVRRGTPLMQIDPALFELQVNALGSETQQVSIDLQKLDIEEKGVEELITLAEREKDIAVASTKRHQALALKKAVSEAELEEVERSELQARNVLRLLLNRRDLMPIRRERLQAQLKLTRLKQEQAQLNLDHTRITAPFSGILTSVIAEQGDYVETGDDLLELVDISTVDVQCSLLMEDLYWLWNSNTVSRKAPEEDTTPPTPVEENAGLLENSLTTDSGDTFEVPIVPATVTGEVAGREFHWKGQLARYGGRGLNRKTRTVLCRVSVDDPVRDDQGDGPPTLMRGMYVTVTLDVEPTIRLWKIPTRAVQPDGRIWTIHDDKLRGHKVRPAKALPDGVLVRADSTDLKPGDRIVVTQLVTPIDGSRVREIAQDGKPTTATSGGQSR